MSVRQLNYTGIVNQPNHLSFQAVSTSDQGTYVLKWENLALVDGCRLRVVIAHQSMESFVRACPEQWGADSTYTNDTDTFDIFPTLSFAGAYVMNAEFTLSLPNLNVTVPPAATSMFLTIAAGDAPGRVPGGLDQRLLGQTGTGPNGSFADTWNWQNQVATLPQATQDAATWNSQGTFRTVFSAGTGTITTGLCRLFTVTYFTTNSSAFDIPATNFEPYFGRDGKVFLASTDSLATQSQQSNAYRISQQGTWQPLCNYNQVPPAFELGSNRLGFGIYFGNPGAFNIFVQTKINGYVVTSSFPINVPDPSAQSNGAQKGRGSGLLAGTVGIVAAMLSSTFL
ncbi:hypothetical protein HKX48_004672 [Thoreauomyces humboldtii]|nr:hypothetical protein HKX48_004672 [Thoreauomyces humboldtii]